MKVKMTNGVVRSLIECLEAMTEKKVELPVKVWYNLSYTRQKLNEAAKAAESVRLKLVDKYGEENEQTKIKTVPNDRMGEFQKEYIELMDTETEVEVRIVQMKDMESVSETMQGVQGIFNFFMYLVKEEKEEAVLQTV